MFHHVALFRWVDGVTPEQVGAIRDRLSELPGLIAEIAAYRVGPDAGWSAGNFAFAVVADFASEADWRAYTDHPAHQAVLKEMIRPLLAERAAVQFSSD